MTETATHTPGPWAVGEFGDDTLPGHLSGCTLIESQYRIDKGLHGNDVAYVAPIKMDAATTKEQEANARLIAAAPDLLAVLDRIVQNPEAQIGGHIRAEAVAAIAKARGHA